MTDAQKETYRIGVIKFAGALISLVILVVAFRELESFLQPLFIAAFFYYASQPIVNFLIQRKVPPFLAYLVPILLVILIFSSLGWLIGANVNNLTERFPLYKQRLQVVYQGSVNWIGDNIPMVGERITPFFSGQKIPLGPLEKFIRAFVGNVFGFFSFGLLVIFFLIFILQEGRTLSSRLEKAYGETRSTQILEIVKGINKGIVRYISVKTIASAAVSLLSLVTMLGFGLDLALLWGALIFFGNYIPYVGSAIAVIFPIVISVLQFGTLGKIIVLSALLILYQIMVGNYLEPRLAGRRLNLSPLLVLISLAFWAWLWGMVGLIVAVPVMMTIRIILENIPSTKPIAVIMSHGGKPKN